MYQPTPIIQFSCNNIMVGNILGSKISSTSLSSDNLCCCCQISIMYWKYLHIVPRQTYTKKLLYSKENKFIYANFINIHLGRHFNKKGEIIALGNIFLFKNNFYRSDALFTTKVYNMALGNLYHSNLPIHNEAEMKKMQSKFQAQKIQSKYEGTHILNSICPEQDQVLYNYYLIVYALRLRTLRDRKTLLFANQTISSVILFFHFRTL